MQAGGDPPPGGGPRGVRSGGRAGPCCCCRSRPPSPRSPAREAAVRGSPRPRARAGRPRPRSGRTKRADWRAGAFPLFRRMTERASSESEASMSGRSRVSREITSAIATTPAMIRAINERNGETRRRPAAAARPSTMTITSERSMRRDCRGNDKKQGVNGPDEIRTHGLPVISRAHHLAMLRAPRVTLLDQSSRFL